MGAPLRYPWADMAPGDWFVVPVREGEDRDARQQVLSSVGTGWCNRNRPDLRCTTRLTDAGVRVSLVPRDVSGLEHAYHPGDRWVLVDAALPTPEEATGPEVYATLRRSIGTQVEVAALLGVTAQLLSYRENGHDRAPIDVEAARAMLHLHLAVFV